jgi:hypothetical protein
MESAGSQLLFSVYQSLNQQNQDGTSTEPAFASLKLTKGAAREVLTNAMPVPELVLNRQITNLARVSLRLVSSLEEERKRKFEANGQRHMIHASHGSIEVTCTCHTRTASPPALPLFTFLSWGRLNPLVIVLLVR